jgi:hypothetical protein
MRGADYIQKARKSPVSTRCNISHCPALREKGPPCPGGTRKYRLPNSKKHQPICVIIIQISLWALPRNHTSKGRPRQVVGHR